MSPAQTAGEYGPSGVEHRGHQRSDLGDVGPARLDDRRHQHQRAGAVDVHLGEEVDELAQALTGDVGAERVLDRAREGDVVEGQVGKFA